MVATVTRLSEAASTVHYFEADGCYAENDPEHRKASRNLGPQIHTHSVIANMTQNAEVQWRSADFIRLERSKLLIGAFYRNELKRRIEALGYATTRTMVGSIPGFEIAGYDRSHLKAFSTRREEALAWARERNLGTSASVMQQAVLYARERKEEPAHSELAAIWRNRTQELGVGRDWYAARGRTAAFREAVRQGHAESRLDRERWHLWHRTEDRREDPSALFTVCRAIEHLDERRTVFFRRHASRAGPGFRFMDAAGGGCGTTPRSAKPAPIRSAIEVPRIW